MGNGEWTLYVEGSTTPHSDGVSNLLPDTNADAGTALDGDGKGRLQVSVLHYLRRFGDHEWVFGPMIARSWLEVA